MNYYATQRKIEETVLIGNQPFRLDVTWRIEEDDEQKIDVRIMNQDGKLAAAFLGLDSTALVSFAEVFLTVERMIRVESVNAERVVDAG